MREMINYHEINGNKSKSRAWRIKSWYKQGLFVMWVERRPTAAAPQTDTFVTTTLNVQQIEFLNQLYWYMSRWINYGFSCKLQCKVSFSYKLTTRYNYRSFCNLMTGLLISLSNIFSFIVSQPCLIVSFREYNIYYN